MARLSDTRHSWHAGVRWSPLKLRVQPIADRDFFSSANIAPCEDSKCEHPESPSSGIAYGNVGNLGLMIADHSQVRIEPGAHCRRTCDTAQNDFPAVPSRFVKVPSTTPYRTSS